MTGRGVCGDRHRHRVVRLQRDGRLLRALEVTVHTTDDRQRAERSRFTYRPGAGLRYRMTLLGFLHGLTGLTIDVKEQT